MDIKLTIINKITNEYLSSQNSLDMIRFYVSAGSARVEELGEAASKHAEVKKFYEKAIELYYKAIDDCSCSTEVSAGLADSPLCPACQARNDFMKLAYDNGYSDCT